MSNSDAFYSGANQGLPEVNSNFNSPEDQANITNEEWDVHKSLYLVVNSSLQQL